MPLQGRLSIGRMCQMAGVSRAGFYRSLRERAPVQEEMEVRSVIQQIAVEHRRLLYKWRDQFDPFDPGEKSPAENSRESTLRKEINQLKRVLVDKTLELDFFKGALQKVEARGQKNGISGKKASTTKSKK